MSIEIQKSDELRYGALPHAIIVDENLSLKAKGLLLYIVDKPEDWRFATKRIATETKDGIDSIRTALAELKEAGYVRQEKKADGSILLRVEGPKTGKTQRGKNPQREKPTEGKTRPSHIHSINTYIEYTHTEDINSRHSKNKQNDTPEAPLEHLNLQEELDKEKAFQLACLLKELIRDNYPRHHFSDNCEKSWATDIERMHRIDGRTWEEIEGAIRWSAGDSFWKQNIWSGKALRKQFDRLWAAAEYEQRKNALTGVVEL